MRTVKFVFFTYADNIQISGDNNNAIDFINKGAANVSVNGVTLSTNQSLSLSCHFDELDNSNYQITFTAPGVQLLNVIKKFID